MYLQLADNADNMYLQDNSYNPYAHMSTGYNYALPQALDPYGLGAAGPQGEGEVEIMDYYLYIPADDGGEGAYVREDQLDHLPDHIFNAIVDNQPFMSGLFGTKKSRMARRNRRKANKAKRKGFRSRKKEARTSRVETRAARAAAGEPTGLERVIGGVGKVVGQITGRGGQDFAPEPYYQDPQQKGLTWQGGFGATQKPWYNEPGVMIGGGLVLLTIIGGIIYFTRKKK